jgi:hypothetical protein
MTMHFPKKTFVKEIIGQQTNMGVGTLTELI